MSWHNDAWAKATPSTASADLHAQRTAAAALAAFFPRMAGSSAAAAAGVEEKKHKPLKGHRHGGPHFANGDGGDKAVCDGSWPPGARPGRIE